MIHEKAHVEDATIGARCRIWQFASVIRGAVIGNDVTIASCAIVDGASVGDGAIVCHGASIHPGAVIGNNVFIGPGVTICNDSWPRTHKLGWHVPAAPLVIVEDGASIGANCVVLPGVRIGAGAMIAAGVTVHRDVEAGNLLGPLGTQSPIIDDGLKVRVRLARKMVRRVA